MLTKRMETLKECALVETMSGPLNDVLYVSSVSSVPDMDPLVVMKDYLGETLEGKGVTVHVISVHVLYM